MLLHSHNHLRLRLHYIYQHRLYLHLSIMDFEGCWLHFLQMTTHIRRLLHYLLLTVHLLPRTLGHHCSPLVHLAWLDCLSLLIHYCSGNLLPSLHLSHMFLLLSRLTDRSFLLGLYCLYRHLRLSYMSFRLLNRLVLSYHYRLVHNS